MKIPANEIHIYRSVLEKHKPELKRFEVILSSDELEKANRYKFENDRNNYIVCRAILRNIIGSYLSLDPSEVTFSYSEKGKPYIKGNNIKFNLAHSKGFAVYAFALENEIGIDVEYLKAIPDAIKIAERYFSEYEIDELKKTDTAKIENLFFICWTRKEAFIKAIGEGLSYPLTDFSVPLKPGEEPKLLRIKNNSCEVQNWSLYNIDVIRNYTSALAVKSGELKIIYKNTAY